MLTLLFGLAAALCWGVHDVCVRFAAERAGVRLALMTMLAAGLAAIIPAALIAGDWPDLGAGQALFAILSGSTYAGAAYALYRAFTIGPVRLVAPVIAAYPILSVMWAGLQGTPPTTGQWIAVLAIVMGVGLIAKLANEPVATPARGEGQRQAIRWSLAASVGFAATFALGQIATTAGAEMVVAALSRTAAVLSLAGALLLSRRWPSAQGAPWGLLVMMGLCDVTAITLVLAAGSLPHPEFASVTSSIFGMVTILLAWAFLGEKVTAPQWGAVGLVFAGVGYLAV